MPVDEPADGPIEASGGGGTPPPPPKAPPGCGAALFGLPVGTWDTLFIVLLTAAADVCLFAHPGGSGLAVLLLVAALGLAWRVGCAGARVGPALPLSLLLIAAAAVWNSGFLVGFVGFAALAAYAIKLRRPDWGVLEFVWTVPQTLLLAPFRLVGHGLRWMGYVAHPKTGVMSRSRRLSFRVIFVPLIVVLLFVLIFIAANPVIEKLAGDISEQLGRWVDEFTKTISIWRMMTWVLWLMAFSALLRPMARSWLGDRLAREPEELGRTNRPAGRDDYLTALVTLAAVNLLFLAFNALDSVYLYFKAELPAGISFSQYSHRGCIWLTLALALSAIVIGAIFRGPLNFHERSRGLRGWSYVWALQNGVLAAGAFRRLQMYIDYNGMTRLRVVAVYGILLVCAGLVLMVWKVARGKNFLWLVRRDAAAFCITLALLALTPSDWISWTYNAGQAMRGNIRPLTNLNEQTMSAESFPPLLPLLDHPDRTVRTGIAGLLGRQLEELRRTSAGHWTEWQGARAWARARLEAARGEIARVVPAEQWRQKENDLREKVRPWRDTIRGIRD